LYEEQQTEVLVIGGGIAGILCAYFLEKQNIPYILAGLTKNMNIYEKTFVTNIEGTTAYTKDGAINAKNIIVATHFPFINRHGSYFMKLYQDRSYVIALENAERVGGMYRDVDKKGLSFRDYGRREGVGESGEERNIR